MSKTTIKQPQTAIQTGGNSSNELYFGKYETIEEWDIDSGRRLPLGMENARTLYFIKSDATGTVYIDCDIIDDNVEYGFLYMNAGSGSATPCVRINYNGAAKSISTSAVGTGRVGYFSVVKSENVLMCFRPLGTINM